MSNTTEAFREALASVEEHRRAHATMFAAWEDLVRRAHDAHANDDANEVRNQLLRCLFHEQNLTGEVEVTRELATRLGIELPIDWSAPH